jgi:hypothetical protein
VQQDDHDENEEKVQADHQDDQKEVTSRMARIRMKISDGRICRMTRRG